MRRRKQPFRPGDDEIDSEIGRAAGGRDLSRTEREYWNRRFESEGEVEELRGRLRSAARLEDDWGLLAYLNRVGSEVEAGDSVLEVGCGLGSQAIPLALSRGLRAVVTDVAVNGLARNREALAGMDGAGSKIDLCAAAAERLPFADEAFDVVLLHAALHHLQEPRGAIREMVRCLRRGGLFVLGYEPNRLVFAPLRSIAGRLRLTERHSRRFVPGSYSVADDETPGFRAAELRHWMIESGLEILRLEPVWFLSAFAYHLPEVSEMLLRRRLEVPSRLRRLCRFADQKLLSRVPGVRRLCFAWSLAARKK